MHQRMISNPNLAEFEAPIQPFSSCPLLVRPLPRSSGPTIHLFRKVLILVQHKAIDLTDTTLGRRVLELVTFSKFVMASMCSIDSVRRAECLRVKSPKMRP